MPNTIDLMLIDGACMAGGDGWCGDGELRYSDNYYNK